MSISLEKGRTRGLVTGEAGRLRAARSGATRRIDQRHDTTTFAPSCGWTGRSPRGLVTGEAGRLRVARSGATRNFKEGQDKSIYAPGCGWQWSTPRAGMRPKRMLTGADKLISTLPASVVEATA